MITVRSASVFFVGAAVGAFTGGLLNARFGRKRMIEAAGCPCLVVGFVLTGVGRFFAVVVLGRQVTESAIFPQFTPT